MKIWLINPYGPIPGESWRAYRFDTMAGILAAAGHEVIWWTSSFSHHSKIFRSRSWKDVAINPRYVIRLVPTTHYTKNISLRRILKDWVFALKTYRRGKMEAAPDLILHAESALTFGWASYELARFHACPIVYDQMDLWPEFIVNSLPRPIRPIIAGLCQPIYWRRRALYRRLDGALALAQPYLDAIFSEAPEIKTIPATVIYNGIDVQQFRQWMEKRSADDSYPSKSPSEFWAIFAGTLGPSYDIQTLILAARRLSAKGVAAKILIAGDGPLSAVVAAAAASCEQLIFLGKLSPERLAGVYSQCDIGLAAYSHTSNVEMPDKYYDYTAAGLAIINSLRGEVSSKIREHDIGFQYEASDHIDLVDKLRLLVTDPELLARLRENSFRVAMEYDVQHQYAQLVEFIGDAVSCNNSKNFNK